jgi:hypothetical protein
MSAEITGVNSLHSSPVVTIHEMGSAQARAKRGNAPPLQGKKFREATRPRQVDMFANSDFFKTRIDR